MVFVLGLTVIVTVDVLVNAPSDALSFHRTAILRRNWERARIWIWMTPALATVCFDFPHYGARRLHSYRPARLRASVQWWQIDPNTLAVLQFGRVDDPNGVEFYGYPSIAVNQNKDVLIG